MGIDGLLKLADLLTYLSNSSFPSFSPNKPPMMRRRTMNRLCLLQYLYGGVRSCPVPHGTNDVNPQI